MYKWCDNVCFSFFLFFFHSDKGNKNAVRFQWHCQPYIFDTEYKTLSTHFITIKNIRLGRHTLKRHLLRFAPGKISAINFYLFERKKKKETNSPPPTIFFLFYFDMLLENLESVSLPSFDFLREFSSDHFFGLFNWFFFLSVFFFLCIWLSGSDWCNEFRILKAILILSMGEIRVYSHMCSMFQWTWYVLFGSKWTKDVSWWLKCMAVYCVCVCVFEFIKWNSVISSNCHSVLCLKHIFQYTDSRHRVVWCVGTKNFHSFEYIFNAFVCIQ